MRPLLAYFITWSTYGSRLHGDERGSFDHKGQFVPPDPCRHEFAESAMVADPVVLTPEQREIVDAVIVDHCRQRQWQLHARNVRTQHVHVVVSADREGDKVREEFKAWASRRLSDTAGYAKSDRKDGRRKWWTEKGNVLEIETETELEQINRYVEEDQ